MTFYHTWQHDSNIFQFLLCAQRSTELFSRKTRFHQARAPCKTMPHGSKSWSIEPFVSPHILLQAPVVRWHASFILMMAAGFPSYKNGMKIMHRSGLFSRLRPNSSASLILTSPLSVSSFFRSQLLNSATGETVSGLKKQKTVDVLFALWEMTQDETTDEAYVCVSDHILLDSFWVF